MRAQIDGSTFDRQTFNFLKDEVPSKLQNLASESDQQKIAIEMIELFGKTVENRFQRAFKKLKLPLNEGEERPSSTVSIQDYQNSKDKTASIASRSRSRQESSSNVRGVEKSGADYGTMNGVSEKDVITGTNRTTSVIPSSHRGDGTEEQVL